MKPFISIHHTAAILVAAIALLLTAGCGDENNEPGGNASNAAIITASIGNAHDVASTRASGTTWSPGDRIGISASSATGKTAYTNILYRNDNGAGGDFLPVPGTDGEDNAIYFQEAGPVSFTAYYPYTGANGTRPGTNGILTRTLTVADQAPDRQPAIDYLHATATADRQSPRVSLSFSHRMSRLELNFKAGAGISLPSGGLTYTLTGLATEGTFNTLTGEARATGTASTLKDLPTTATAAQPTGTAILWPQPASSVLLQLTLEGTTFSAPLTFPSGTAGEALAPSTSYTFNVTVQRTNLEISQAGIKDWTYKDGQDVIMQ